ncbi:MAG: fatty acid desaturase CarF family protein [Candidatus Sericytochromatia bacterium]
MAKKVLFPNGIPEGYSGNEEDPGIVMAILLYFSTYIFPILFTISIYLSVKNLIDSSSYLSLIIAFPIAWIGGDFLSGLIHWACDTYGTVNTPILGHALIRNFRSHHTYPKDICVSPIPFIVGYVAIVALFTLTPLILILKDSNSFSLSIFTFIYAIITFLTVLTNLFHKWTHEDNVPSWVTFLQNKKIILSPEHHKFHHTYPFNSNYCITHGLTNPFLEKIGFFRKFEFLLLKLGFKPDI